jgi:PAS domain S-box-containing protein
MKEAPSSMDAGRPDGFALSAMFVLAPIGLAQFDMAGRFLLVNDRLCEILGFSRDQLHERTFQEITFPDDLGHCVALNHRLAAGEIPNYCVDKRFVRPDDSVVWARITVSAARHDDGAVAFFIGAAEDVTAQVTAAESLRVAEERLRTAIDASMIGTFRFNVRRNHLDWADGLERVFGTADQFTLDEFFAVIHPEDRPHLMAAYVKSVREGADLEEEFRVFWPDGSVHWLHDRGRTLPGEDGRPEFIIGAITDVTNHKRMEEVINIREAQFRTLANGIPQLAWMADNDGHRSWFNDRWLAYTGATLDEMRGLGWTRVHDPETVSGMLTRQLAAFRSAMVWEETVRLRGRDGKYRWFLARAQPVRKPDGSILHWVGTNTDITDRLEREHELETREQRYRRALDVETAGVIFFDNEHRIKGINQAFEHMSGYSNDEIADVMTLWRDLQSEGQRDFARAREHEYDTTGRTTPAEHEFIRKDGTHWWGLVTATRVSDMEGVKFVLDITARKDAEHEREEVLRREQSARLEAERATALRDQVLGYVAHDLRNPVHTIVMAAGSVLDFALPPERERTQLELIRKSAWVMDRLIGDLLDVSQIEAGTLAVHCQPIALGPVVTDVIADFHDRARALDITLHARVQPELPPIDADRQRLVQALSNLVGNALKFTPPGGRVVIEAAQRPTCIELVVRDSGKGIAPQHLGNVFERFWQADRTCGGAGLGLAIVQGIMEAHHGSVHAESEPGHGATFSLRLPQVEPPAGDFAMSGAARRAHHAHM